MKRKTKIKKRKVIGDPNNKNNSYRTVKCKLITIIKDVDILPIINDYVSRSNNFAVIGYQFIRSYLIYKFNKNEQFPKLNKEFILDCLKVIGETNTKQGKKTDKNISNKGLKNELQIYYDNYFSKLVPHKLNYTKMTYILAELAKEMLSCIKINLSTHFLKYICRLINVTFKNPRLIEIKKEKDKDKRKQLKYELSTDMRNIKLDIINATINLSKNEYHAWINETIKNMLPPKIDTNIGYDSKKNPEKYLKYAFYINQKIEQTGQRPFQVIPQRNNICPKYIDLNTEAIIEIFADREKTIFDYDKGTLHNNPKKYQSHIWSKILKLENRRIFNQRGYKFYNQISTDGISCSILFIREDLYNKKYGNKVPDSEEIIFKNLSDMTKEECDQYKDIKSVANDPGKKEIISLIDDKGNVLKYTCVQRRHETYGKKSNKIINDEKKKNNINEIEKKLSNYNSRTLDAIKYDEFIKNKLNINDQLKSFYENPLFRNLKFRRYCRTKQSEENLLNKIEEKYGKEIVFAYGNWSRTSQMANFMPTPGIGMRKLIASRFETITTDEYKTSLLKNGTFEELENLKIKRGKHMKKIHAVLTQKGEPAKRTYCNRNTNASKNILLIFNTYIRTQTRPAPFMRNK